MNWGKATAQSKISKHGFEQGSEFGDVIDKSRQRAAVEHAKLSSKSRQIVRPSKSERQRLHEVRVRQQAQDKKRKQLARKKSGARTQEPSVSTDASASNPKSGKNMALKIYLETVRSLISGTTRQAAYDRVIDDFLKDGAVRLMDVHKPVRKLVEAMILIRLAEKI